MGLVEVLEIKLEGRLGEVHRQRIPEAHAPALCVAGPEVPLCSPPLVKRIETFGTKSICDLFYAGIGQGTYYVDHRCKSLANSSHVRGNNLAISLDTTLAYSRISY